LRRSTVPLTQISQRQFIRLYTTQNVKHLLFLACWKTGTVESRPGRVLLCKWPTSPAPH